MHFGSFFENETRTAWHVVCVNHAVVYALYNYAFAARTKPDVVAGDFRSLFVVSGKKPHAHNITNGFADASAL